jgi:hypothetical protein
MPVAEFSKQLWRGGTGDQYLGRVLNLKAWQCNLSKYFNNTTIYICIYINIDYSNAHGLK